MNVHESSLVMVAGTIAWNTICQKLAPLARRALDHALVDLLEALRVALGEVGDGVKRDTEHGRLGTEADRDGEDEHPQDRGDGADDRDDALDHG